MKYIVIDTESQDAHHLGTVHSMHDSIVPADVLADQLTSNRVHEAHEEAQRAHEAGKKQSAVPKHIPGFVVWRTKHRAHTSVGRRVKWLSGPVEPVELEEVDDED